LVAATFGVLAAAGESVAAAPPPSKAQAKAFAQAVNLRTGDIPGFKKGSVGKTTAADRKMGAEVAACAGGVDPNRAVVDLESADFTSASGIIEQDISSEVEVLPSAALVAKDLASVKSSKGRGCVARALDKEFAAMKIPGVTFGKVSSELAIPQANGASGSFALRLTTTATAHGEKIPYYADFLGFSLGQAEVTLSALGFAEPVSAKDELGLFSVLLRRAEAASL
jgi:hypothetical protein